MYYTIKQGPAHQQKTDCVIVPIWANKKLSTPAQEIDKASGGMISQLVNAGEIEGKLGQTLMLQQLPNVAAARVLLIGCDEPQKFTPGCLQMVISKAMCTVAETAAKSCCAYLIEFEMDRSPDWQLLYGTFWADQTFYRFDKFKSKKEPYPKTLSQVDFGAYSTPPEAEALIAKSLAISKAVYLARDLGNLPGNICTPTYMAEQAKQLAKNNPSLKVNTYDRDALKQMGMNAILAVAQGSQQSPQLITLEYHGGPADQAPVVFVGKGITFDSGGISLKPGDRMDEMKFDMCGAANVLAILSAVAETKMPINVVGIAACSENLPSGSAYKPGDVITTLSGQTIEILNTDAEGRVLLSDALTFAEKFKPECVIDMATLTGAIIIALGDKASGLMTTDDKLADELNAAGLKSWDRVWRLPLWDEYQEQIKSPIADMANLGAEGGKSITAACLLSRFAKNYRWAHLDIAGTAWGKDKQATGRAIPLLMQFLAERAKQK